MGPGTAAEVALALKAKKPVVLLGTQVGVRICGVEGKRQARPGV